MIKILTFLGGLVSVLSQGKVFRFDYEFDSGANGWLKYHLIPATWQEARMRCQAEGKEFRYDYNFSTQADGWLKFHVIPGTWSEARMRCHAEGAVLASPLTNQLKGALISLVINRKGCPHTMIHTGIHSTFSKGDYASIEGVPLGRLPITWAPGEPDNFENAESCLAMLTDAQGSMSDVRCGDVLPYICYKKDAHVVMTQCGTTDPAYVLEPRTGSCYKFHNRGLPWSQAYMTCMAEGGYLAIINSDIEAVVIKEKYQVYPDNTIRSTDPGILAIGFHNWGQHGSYMTIHGDTLDVAGYQKWAKNQPDNATRARTVDLGEYCGSTFRDALLNDVWCNVAIPFVCEKSRDSLLRM